MTTPTHEVLFTFSVPRWRGVVAWSIGGAARGA
jgi:hypothetical protein